MPTLLLMSFLRASLVAVTGSTLLLGTSLAVAGAADAPDPVPGVAQVLPEQPDQSADPDASQHHADDRVVVQWDAGVSRQVKTDIVEQAGGEGAENLGSTRFQVVALAGGQSAKDAVASLESDPNVASAALDTYVQLDSAGPDDPLFAQLWGLENTGAGVAGVQGAVAGDDISALAAWDRTTGGADTVVADIDGGYRFQHPDLRDRAWTNPAESDDGVDNDGNGIVDDIHGADFVGSDIDVSPLPVDGDATDDLPVGGGHGVHTAGTIAAAGDNGIGITGVAQQASIMPIRVCSYSPTFRGVFCPSSAIIAGINYAGTHGARVANLSLGGSTANTMQRDAMAQHPDTLYVVSAGNDASDNDARPKYPCVWNPADAAATIPEAVDNVVCVAATDQADHIASFSNWGRTSVDLAAPGTEILSTYVNRQAGAEDFEGGFSFADWTNNGFAAATGAPLTSSGITNDTATQPPSSTRDTMTPEYPVTGPATCTLRYWRKLTSISTGDQFTYRGMVDGSQVNSTTGSNQSPAFYSVDIPIPAGDHSVAAKFQYVRGASTPTANGVWLDDVSINCWAAPGQEDSTSYAFLQGTSMAAPHVTGAAALLATYEPKATVSQLRAALLSSVDLVADLDPTTGTHPVTSGGRLNADAALQAVDALVAPDTEFTQKPADPSKSDTESLAFRATGTGAPATFECDLDGAGYSACTSPFQASGLTSGTHTFRVRAKDTSTASNVDPTPAETTWTTVLDSTPPDITPQVDGVKGDSDWYRSDVAVSWTVTDAESDVSAKTGCDPVTVAADTSGQTLTCSATSAGGTGEQSVTIARDATAPSVQLVGGPSDGGEYGFGAVPVAPSCTASDATSGLAGPCIVSGYADTLGTHTVTATVKDAAGNTSSSTATYTVSGWRLVGFFQPVRMGGVMNVVRHESTVPLKFQVFAGATEQTNTSAVRDFAAERLTCKRHTRITGVRRGEDHGGGRNRGTALRYDAASGQFILKWVAPEPGGRCYRTTVTTRDGSSLSALFEVR